MTKQSSPVRGVQRAGRWCETWRRYRMNYGFPSFRTVFFRRCTAGAELKPSCADAR